MAEGRTKLEVVRQAKEQRGDVSPGELAAFIQTHFGIEIKPAIVAVLLASLREREQLESSRRKASEAVERAREEAAKGKKGDG